MAILIINLAEFPGQVPVHLPVNGIDLMSGGEVGASILVFIVAALAGALNVARMI